MMIIFSLFPFLLQTKKLVLLPEGYQFVFKKKDLPNTELRYINWGIGNVLFVFNPLKTQKVDIYLNRNDRTVAVLSLRMLLETCVHLLYLPLCFTDMGCMAV